MRRARISVGTVIAALVLTAIVALAVWVLVVRIFDVGGDVSDEGWGSPTYDTTS